VGSRTDALSTNARRPRWIQHPGRPFAPTLRRDGCNPSLLSAPWLVSHRWTLVLEPLPNGELAWLRPTRSEPIEESRYVLRPTSLAFARMSRLNRSSLRPAAGLSHGLAWVTPDRPLARPRNSTLNRRRGDRGRPRKCSVTPSGCMSILARAPNRSIRWSSVEIVGSCSPLSRRAIAGCHQCSRPCHHQHQRSQPCCTFKMAGRTS
jgi:hypothetical protein